MANNINFSEVIYCSSQKSIITGMAGFQVRSHTASIDSQVIDALSNSNIYGYPLSSERQVSLSQLQDNPSIVYNYPQTFVYKKIVVANETTKYIFARTVYIGVDYGYFCGLENMRRAGSNYFTHALVFDQQPPQDLFLLLLQNNYFGNNVFLPLDYTCLPSNPELFWLLTGEPHTLPLNAFFITGQIAVIPLADYTADMIIGLVQLYINRRLGDTSKHLIIKVSDNLTNYLAGIIKVVLPSKLTGSLTFQTNYYKDGVADDLDIVFVNEHYTGTLYESDHICIDYFTNNHIGIDNNYLYEHIRKLVVSKNRDELIGLLEYLCNIEIGESNDYRFICNLFILTKSQQDIAIKELSFDFLQKLSTLNLSVDNRAEVWYKINFAINLGLSSNDTSSIKETLRVCSDIVKLGLVKECHISKVSTTSFSKFIFDVPYNFADIVAEDNYKTAINFIDKEIVASSSRLLNALNSEANYEIWLYYINYFLSADNITAQSSIILEQIAQSNLTEQSLIQLTEALYSNNKSVVFNYMQTAPHDVVRFKGLLFAWCATISLQQLSRIMVSAQSNVSNHNILHSVINQLFANRISGEANLMAVFSEFNEFVKLIGVSVANTIGVADIVDMVAEKIEKSPSDKYRPLIQELADLKVKINANAAKIFNLLLKISSNDTPQNVDLKAMIMAYQLKRGDILEAMFGIWLQQGISQSDLKQFVVVANGLEEFQPLIGKFLFAVWQSRAQNIKSKKREYVNVIIDNARWQKSVKATFLKNSADSSLVSYITQSSSFINKLVRKIIK